MPAFTPSAEQPQAPFRMQQVDVERSQEFRKCIECLLCQDTCHVIRDHDENKPAFSGPRFFIRYAELEMHPNDARRPPAAGAGRPGLGLCNITKCCTEVCPENIKITDNAIIPMKERVVDVEVRPVCSACSAGAKQSQAWPRPQTAPTPGALACPACVTRTCGAVWSARRPVKPEDAGSNPVRSAVG